MRLTAVLASQTVALIFPIRNCAIVELRNPVMKSLTSANSGTSSV